MDTPAVQFMWITAAPSSLLITNSPPPPVTPYEASYFWNVKQLMLGCLSRVITQTTVSSARANFAPIAVVWASLCGLVEWVPTIKTEWQSKQSEPLPTWHVPICFMRHSTGLIGPSLIFGL
jgi:hypothetical protein